MPDDDTGNAQLDAEAAADGHTDAHTADDDTADDRTGAAAADGHDDDLHRAFRAALQRKAAHGAPHEQHLDARGAGHGNNDTHRRQFRRKSG